MDAEVVEPEKPDPEAFLDVVRAFAEGTSGHGWGKIATARAIYLKIFWVLICLGGTGVAAWQITTLFITYFDYPYTTKIEMRFEVQPFPAITICNQNQFRRSTVEAHGGEFREIIESYLTKMKSKMFKERQPAPSGNDHGGSQLSTDGSKISSGATLPSGGQVTPAAGGAQPPASGGEAPQADSGGGKASGSGSATTQAGAGPTPASGEPTTQAGVVKKASGSGNVTTQAGAETTTASGDLTTQAGVVNASGSGGATTQAGAGPTAASGDQTTQAGAKASGSGSATTQAGAGPTTAYGGQTTQAQAGAKKPPPSGKKKKRKKRRAQRLASEDVDVSDAFFKPDVDMSEMSWFDNPGEKAASSENGRNLSVVIAGMSLDDKRQMGHQIEDMVQECIWSGRTCTPDNFTMFYSRDYGNCYTFNSGEVYPLAYSSKPGPKYGLSLTLMVEQDEYVPSLSPSAGLRALIHRQDTQPFPDEDGLDISPGMKTSISLRRVSVTRLPYPWGNCTNGTELTLMYSKNYSIPACVRTCIQNKSLEVCGCGDPALPLPTGISYCKNVSELACLDSVELDYQLDKFQCPCRQSCWDDLYQKTVSSSEWPADSFKTTIIEQYAQRSQRLAHLLSSPEGPKKHLLKLEIFFEELSYTRLEEVKDYPPENLLGDMGGQLGLWLGMSVITIIEVLEFFMFLLRAILCRRRVSPEKKMIPLTPLEKKAPLAWT